jgi:hypothetical protein
MAKLIPAALLLFTASTSFALPRPNTHVRAGANHHLGDDSFIAKYGHNVDSHASEGDRMHQHLQFVRDWLASRPATRPELAKRRAEILAHFDAYIAKDTTPKNVHVPWRTPVFIDDEGTICAVGYLIQQTTTPELPQRIAKAHRYDFIEDIATAMPEVADWVASSGFTLDEIAHIQPAYTEPQATTWWTWNLKKHPPKEGAYDKNGDRGTFKHGQMEGSWVTLETNDDKEQRIVGHGEMKHGRGLWTSVYDDGKTFGEGPYVNNTASGEWKLYHESGNLAAEGTFKRGFRAGLWRFYYDTPAKTPIAIGKFDATGKVAGKWKHFDDKGELVATTWTETPDQWHDTDWGIDGGEGFMLDVTARPGEVKHASHSGTVNSVGLSLDMYALGGERIYVDQSYGSATMYDEDGFKLEHTEDGAWSSANCHWNAKRKAYARRGDLVPLHGALYTDARVRVHPKHEGVGGFDGEDGGPACSAATTIGPLRAAKLDALLAARDQVRALTPQFVRSAILGEERAEADIPDDALSDEDRANLERTRDLARVLEENMSTYLEWPHIDGRFNALFKRLPGRRWRGWSQSVADLNKEEDNG